MKVAFDASFLVFLINPKASASVERASERVDGLISKLTSRRDKIVIPTPALAEVLVSLDQSGPAYIEKIKKHACFQVRAFDERAAIEFGVAVRARKTAVKKATVKMTPRNKVKFDHQIVAIAKVQGATILYSDDGKLRNFARECGLDAVSLADVEIPQKQEELDFQRTMESSA